MQLYSIRNLKLAIWNFDNLLAYLNLATPREKRKQEFFAYVVENWTNFTEQKSPLILPIYNERWKKTSANTTDTNEKGTITHMNNTCKNHSLFKNLIFNYVCSKSFQGNVSWKGKVAKQSVNKQMVGDFILFYKCRENTFWVLHFKIKVVQVIRKPALKNPSICICTWYWLEIGVEV